jgi:hypothetical protein
LGTAIGGKGGSAGFFLTTGTGNGASVSLISNGGVNDAIGGATSGTLNLTQTAIGGDAGGTFELTHGNFGGAGGSASPGILTGTNPFGASAYNLNANATGGNATAASFGGNAFATADGSASKTGIANATAKANGGSRLSFRSHPLTPG